MSESKSEIFQEVRQLLENLLHYDSNRKLSSTAPFKLKTIWHQKNLTVITTLDDLIAAKVLEPTKSFSSLPSYKTTNSREHLRYLLKKILEEKLNLLEDNRAKNNQGTYRGIKDWKFILKLWYSPEAIPYIERNLRAFDQHWDKIYKPKRSKQLIYQNLPPRQHTQLFGYQSELKYLLRLLSPESREQIIRIEGMGGSGKTSLASEVAHYCLEVSKDRTNPLSFDAIIFTSAQSNHVLGNSIMPKLLGADQCLGDIVRTISDTLKFPLEPSLDFTRQLQLLINHLNHKLVLLIIDNLETVEDRDAIANLISHFPETVKVIVTSRVPFAQPNSCSITLTHLQPEPGAELIEDLAKKFQRILSPKQIDSIYKQTGGLPLAITYLVAQIVTTGIPNEEIPKVLDKTPDELLKFCFADLVKFLANTPAYPYLLITALFTQYASVEAIAFIAQTTEQITSDNLQHLANLHLLFAQKTKQYTLHSLTQEYLQLELERQPIYEAQIRDRQVQWYLQLVEPYKYLSADEWHDYHELEAEWINLRSVIEWCIMCDRYLDVKNFWQGLKGFTTILGYWRERKIWLEWLSDKAVEQQDWQMIAEAKFHFSQTLARIDQSDNSGEAIKLAREAWKLREHCSSEWEFDLSLFITILYVHQQNPDAWKTAQQWCDDSQKLLDTFKGAISTSLKKQCQLLRYQGEIYLKEQQLERALDSFQAALEIAENINYRRGIAYIRAQISIVLIQQNKLTKARQELLFHLETTKKYRDRRSQSFCYQHLATIAKKMNNEKEAKQYAILAQEHFTNLGMEAAAKAMKVFLIQ